MRADKDSAPEAPDATCVYKRPREYPEAGCNGYSVDPYECGDWLFCPYCGRKIKWEE